MNDKPDRLDDLLQDWVARNQPTGDRLARLRMRINEAVAAPPLSASPVRRSPARYVLLVAVALSLLAAATVWLNRDEPSDHTVNLSPATEVAPVPREHLGSLLTEMERLFDHRLAWIAETNREVLLEIEDSPSPPANTPRVAVRVVVLRRDSADAAWRNIWTGDVASRSEELVELHSSADGSKLNLWTHVLPDGAVAVDMELAGLGEDGTVWKSTSVQPSSSPITVLTTRQGDSEFQVWQTAALLPEAVL